MATRHAERTLPLVFPTLDDAEQTVNELHELGIADDHLDEALHEPGPYKIEEYAEPRLIRFVGIGICVGTVVGIGVGIAIFALGRGGLGGLPVEQVLLAGGWAGIIFGVFFGGLAGLVVAGRGLDEEEHFSGIALEPGEILVLAKSHGHPGRIRTVAEAHGARVLPPCPAA